VALAFDFLEALWCFFAWRFLVALEEAPGAEATGALAEAPDGALPVTSPDPGAIVPLAEAPDGALPVTVVFAAKAGSARAAANTAAVKAESVRFISSFSSRCSKFGWLAIQINILLPQTPRHRATGQLPRISSASALLKRINPGRMGEFSDPVCVKSAGP